MRHAQERTPHQQPTARSEAQFKRRKTTNGGGSELTVSRVAPLGKYTVERFGLRERSSSTRDAGMNLRTARQTRALRQGNLRTGGRNHAQGSSTAILASTRQAKNAAEREQGTTRRSRKWRRLALKRRYRQSSPQQGGLQRVAADVNDTQVGKLIARSLRPRPAICNPSIQFVSTSVNRSTKRADERFASQHPLVSVNRSTRRADESQFKLVPG